MDIFHSHACGLDISDRSVKIVELKKAGKRFELISVGYRELAPGIVEDGTILNDTRLAEAIRILAEKHLSAPLTTRRIAIALPESRTIRYTFTFPKRFTEKEIEEAIPYEAEKVVPFDTSSAYWDFTLQGEHKGSQMVAYAAAPEKLITDYIEVIAHAGFALQTATLEAQALVKSLVSWYNHDELVALIDIGARTSTISITDQTGIWFTYSVPVAGNHFTEATAKALNLPVQEAEVKRIKNGLTLKQIQNAVMPLLTTIAHDIRKAAVFTEKKVGKKVTKVILCGGSSLMPGIQDALASEIKLPIEIGNPWREIEATDKPDTPLLYATVLGLAMRGLDSHSPHTMLNLLKHN
ncbi:MAG: Type IV pilus assembly protein PilM [Parcubacteria group bacterium GW2011_GWA2_48_9]|nr:MAG: Type IV pilus assembly protein PilM [Parcubacteria group bacterium GW2011_GWA2_48_9]